MAKRFMAWVIVTGATPTAFRSRYREDLLPTLHQLQRKQPDARLVWFERNRFWESPEAARIALEERRRSSEGRDRDWRPGGEHKDPRAKYQLTRDEKRARFKARQRRDFADGGPPPKDKPRDERGPRPDRRGPNPERRGPNPERRGPRPEWRGPKPEGRGPARGGPKSGARGPSSGGKGQKPGGDGPRGGSRRPGPGSGAGGPKSGGHGRGPTGRGPGAGGRGQKPGGSGGSRPISRRPRPGGGSPKPGGRKK